MMLSSLFPSKKTVETFFSRYEDGLPSKVCFNERPNSFQNNPIQTEEPNHNFRPTKKECAQNGANCELCE